MFHTGFHYKGHIQSYGFAQEQISLLLPGYEEKKLLANMQAIYHSTRYWRLKKVCQNSGLLIIRKGLKANNEKTGFQKKIF